jgi:O-antigen ligase
MLGCISIAYGLSLLYNEPGFILLLLALIVGALLLSVVFSVWPALNQSTATWVYGFLPVSMGLWLVWLLAAAFWSTFPQISGYMAWSIAAVPLVFLLWVYPLPAERFWRRLFTVFCVLTALAAVWGMADYAATAKRSDGPFVDANAFGALLNLFFFAALLPYLRLQKLPRAHFWRLRGLEVFFALLLLALFATYSRGAIGCFLILLPVAFFLARRHHGHILRGALIVVCIAVVSYTAVKLYPAHTISRTLDLAHDSSFQARVMMWQSMLHIYRDHPWLGTGIGTYKLFYPAYRNPLETSSSGDLGHQDYLQFLQEQGPLGLGFFLLCALAVLWLGWRLDARARSGNADNAAPCVDALGLLLGTAALFGQALVNFIFYIPALTIPVGLFMGRAYTLTGKPRFRRLAINVRPGLLKLAVILASALPVGGLFLDGVIDGVLLKQSHLPIANAIRNNDRRLYHFAALAEVLRPRNLLPYATLGHFDLAAATHASLAAPVRAQFAGQARHDYLTMLRLNPRSSAARGGLAALLSAYPALAQTLPDGTAGDPDTLLKQAIRYDPLYLPAYQMLAARYVAHGKKRKALRLLGQKATFWFAVKADAKARRISVLEQAITIAKELHDRAAVEALSRNLLANDPRNAVVLAAWDGTTAMP